jgi:protein-L-isoaspartate(D-aspartate) O-methyltransferase
MKDSHAAREKMVDCQVRPNDITEHALISAMLTVEREKFVPESLIDLAYTDREIPLDDIGGTDRFLGQAADIAALIAAAEIHSDDIVLMVGAGSGYSTAIVSLLASSVFAIESNERLSKFASTALSANGFDNVMVFQEELSSGHDKEAPYNAIIIEGSVDKVPPVIIDQLAEGGRLIAVVGNGNSAKLTVVEKADGLSSARVLANCAMKQLPGFEIKPEFSL